MREWILGWDMFSLQVRQQLLDITVMFLCGMFIGVLRTAELYIVRRIRLSFLAGWILEVLFWTSGGFVAAEFLYYCAYGALSFHGLGAMLFGFFLWKRAFCAVGSGQDGIHWSIMKRSIISEKTTEGQGNGKNETKPLIQKRKRKQRHQH